MRISHFFIDRPIFASVVSIVFIILGGVAFLRLPVAQYPEIQPPIINVSGQYPGANADVIASTVVAPIEEQINGVENMLYMSSNSNGDGRFTIQVTFDIGTNLDIAQVQVQNRVGIAAPRLPQDVRQIGVNVVKSSPDLMLVVHVYSPDRSRDPLYVSNYANLEIKDTLTRVDGVGSLTIFGERAYAMRIWLDPHRLQVDEPDRHRRDDRVAGAEHPGRLRRAQPAAGRYAGRVPGPGADAGPARRSRRVRQHRGQDHAAGGGAAQGRGAHPAGRAGLHVELLSQPRSGGGDGGVPAAGLERAADRQGDPRNHGKRWPSVSRPASPTPSSTTPPSSSSSRSRRCRRRSSRRSCSSCWW